MASVFNQAISAKEAASSARPSTCRNSLEVSRAPFDNGASSAGYTSARTLLTMLPSSAWTAVQLPPLLPISPYENNPSGMIVLKILHTTGSYCPLFQSLNLMKQSLTGFVATARASFRLLHAVCSSLNPSRFGIGSDRWMRPAPVDEERGISGFAPVNCANGSRAGRSRPCGPAGSIPLRNQASSHGSKLNQISSFSWRIL